MTSLNAHELAAAFDTLGKLIDDAAERGDWTEFHLLMGARLVVQRFEGPILREALRAEANQPYLLGTNGEPL